MQNPSTKGISSSAIILFSNVGQRCFIGDNTKLCYSSLDDMSYIGDNSHIMSTSIGKFCSISWNVTLGPGVHDYKRISQHGSLFAPKFGLLSKPMYNQYDKDCVIGNDVQIGCNAVVMRGVEIGDGCIIGANTVVCKHTPPLRSGCWSPWASNWFPI